MFHQKNLNKDDSHHQIPYSTYLNIDLPTSQPQQYEGFDDCSVYNKHDKNSSNNQFQIFDNQSFHTISRLSLQMLPDPYVMEVGQEKLELVNKYSNNSIFMGSDNEDQTRLQSKLITQTQQLSLNQNKEDEISQFQYSSLGSSHKDKSKHQKQKFSKIFSPKNIKKLLKQLKFRNIYEEKIKGSFKIRVLSQVIECHQGYIRPILQKKRGILGLIIENKEKMIKMRVNSELTTKTQIHLQLWREKQQNWVQATISAKIKDIRNQKNI